jgi:SSS family solute:Na+ symporter
MGVFLAISLTLAISGGLITLMVTDCIEGIISQLLYLFIIVGVLCVVSWSEMSAVLGTRPAGESMVNPFDAWNVQDFNLWYVLMGVFLSTYGTMAWQNSGSYNSAGITPHETRMAGLLGRWRESGKTVVVVLLAAAAITYLGHPDFAAASAEAKSEIAAIGQPQIQTQMTIPVALSYLLPIGIKGALAAVLLLGIFGGDSTHLHSWGGILAQDIILPRLKKAPPPERHIKILRWSIIAVALFAFIFGALFRQTEYIIMWWSVTTAVYVGGAGAAIIGGLYWKKGTSAGAWAAAISGSIFSGGGILAYKLLGDTYLSDWLNAALGLVGLGGLLPAFTLNGVQISLFATLIAITLYVVISLFTCRQDYPINKMLHRDELPTGPDGKPLVPKRPWTLERIVGIDANFSRSDKWITGSLFAWALFWFSVLVVGSVWNLVGQTGAISWVKPWSNEAWLGFWHITGIGLPILLTVITGVWFTWGGVRDIRALFKSLKLYKVDDSDNGTVSDHKPH